MPRKPVDSLMERSTISRMRTEEDAARAAAAGLRGSAVLSIVCAVIIITNPFKSTAVLWQFTAIVLILEAVFDIIVLLWNRTEGNAA